MAALHQFDKDKNGFFVDAALGVSGLAAGAFEALDQVVGGEGGVFVEANHVFKRKGKS